MSEQHSHRPTKHINKPFKSRHASKGQQKDIAKGKTQRVSLSVKHKANDTKATRRNKAKQLRIAKQKSLLHLGGLNHAESEEKSAPRVIAVVSLCEDIAPISVAERMFPDGMTEHNGIHYASFKSTQFQLILPPHGQLFANVDACTAADYVVLALSSSVEVAHYGENLLRCITALGVPESGIRACIPHFPANETAVTHQSIRKSLLSYVNHFFPSINKIHHLESENEVTNMVRTVSESAPRGVSWREERARVLVESSSYAASTEELSLTGTIRGAHLSADKLIHVPNVGDFQIARIERAVAPHARRTGKGKQKEQDAASMQVEGADILAVPSPEDADDLQSHNEPTAEELLMQEQTWPTEEEMAQGGGHMEMDGPMLPPALPGTTPKVIKRVPKGTSEYQAAWIVDEDASEDDEEEEEEEDEEEDEAMMADDASEVASTAAGPSVSFSLPAGTGAGGSSYYGAESTQHDEEAYQAYKAQRRDEAREDADFPDEVDTPQDMPAHERFAKYRGLKSFRTSKWDPFENLPQDYSKCFMLENFKSMSRNVVTRANQEGIPPGTHVTVVLKNVSATVASHFTDAKLPIVIFGLHKHEHKYSVMHFTVTRNTEYEEELKSKDAVILMLGPRRFVINPLFSQHAQGNNGKGINNVHKFLKYVQPGVSAVGSAYLPISFGSNTPALLINPATLELISSGTLLSSDPKRIIAKRIILTGHPYKLHKKTATIRYMFFNADDVHYFKPIELHTKKGRKGHIRESLGTHGYFKAGFDGPMDQMDTVCLNLYKRCFPKWSQLYVGAQQTPATQNVSTVTKDVEMEL